MNNFALAIGSVVGAFVVEAYGFDMMFYIMAMMALFSGLYVYLLPRKVL